MNPLWGLAADGLLVFLLVGVIVTAVRLEGALRVIRGNRGAFEALVVNLSSAIDSVQAGIKELRNEADRAAGHIGQSSQEADKMATDLSFLIEAADRAGGRLEDRIRSVHPAVNIAVHESKSVRTARKLRAGILIPRPLQSSVPLDVPAHGPAPSAARPTSPGQDSRPSGLLKRAGITTRRLPSAGKVPGNADDSGMPSAESVKKVG